MATYNVFVPARKGSDMPDLSIKVEASNWLVALKESLRQIGEQGDALANIVCETGPDGSLRIADPGSKRVFVIRQAAETTDDDALVQEADRRAAESRAEAEAAAVETQAAESRLQDMEEKISGPATAEVPVFEAAPTAPPEAPAAPEPGPDPAILEMQRQLEEQKAKLEAELQEARQKLEAAANRAAEEATGVLGKVEVKERRKDSPEAAKDEWAGDEWDDLDDWYDGDEPEEETIDGMVADVFLATDSLHEEEEAVAAKHVLELANQHVEAEASSIFFSDMNSALKDLIIIEASGPVADKIKGIHVPVGKGIVGFCVQNGVKLTVNSVQQNPNFYGKLDQEFGFRTSSVLCVPILHGSRTYGAIELINKKGDGKWSTNDANVLESLGMILGRAIETRLDAKKD
jgi:GAF domain-containing protein